MATTRLGLGGGPRAAYVGFTAREPSPVVSEDFFGAGDDQREEEDEIIMVVIKGFIKRVT